MQWVKHKEKPKRKLTIKEGLVTENRVSFDLMVVMKGCYVELYSEQWVSFCLQNCKYKLIFYFVTFGKVIFDFENLIITKNEITAKLLSNLLGDLYFNKK